jgi:hypothetical protein
MDSWLQHLVIVITSRQQLASVSSYDDALSRCSRIRLRTTVEHRSRIHYACWLNGPLDWGTVFASCVDGKIGSQLFNRGFGARNCSQ